MTEKLRHAIFPGSFDPLTNGHVDLIQRSCEIFDRIIVAVLVNPEKKTLFSAVERVRLIEESLGSVKDVVEVKTFSGLLVDFAKREGIDRVLRGLRAITDYDYEAQLALLNRNMYPKMETLFLMTSEQYSYLSSTLVKQVAQYGGDASPYVPQAVAQALAKKFHK